MLGLISEEQTIMFLGVIFATIVITSAFVLGVIYYEQMKSGRKNQ